MPWNPPKLTFLITGAGSGFGLALTRLALSHNHKVIATSRSPSRNPSLVAEIESLGGQFLALDLDDLDSDKLIQRLEDQGTAIDVLVNNAGWARLGASETFTEEEVRQQMETIFFGPYRLIRAVIPHMRRRRRGMILNLGSGAGVDGRDSMSVYGGSKSAIDGLMRVLGKELAAFNIRTLTVQLGAFATGFSSAVTVARAPLPEDYRGTLTETILSSMQGGTFKLDGDHIKATQVLYEMVIGEGFGAGKEDERVMVLGRDMWKVVERVDTQWRHMMEVFGDVCNNVYLED